MRNATIIFGFLAIAALMLAGDSVKGEQLDADVGYACIGTAEANVVLVVSREPLLGIAVETACVHRIDLPGEPVGTVMNQAAPVRGVTAHSSGGLPT